VLGAGQTHKKEGKLLTTKESGGRGKFLSKDFFICYLEGGNSKDTKNSAGGSPVIKHIEEEGRGGGEEDGNGLLWRSKGTGWKKSGAPHGKLQRARLFRIKTMGEAH